MDNRHGITLTILHNPFNTAGREIVQLDYLAGKTIVEYCADHMDGQEDFIYSLNGERAEGSVVPTDGDFIAICPVIKAQKNLLATVLMIGLMIFAPTVATAFGATGVTASLITASVMLIGGALISMLCPTQAGDNTASDPVYSWGSYESLTEQGGALAKTYGTMKTGGTIISRHVTTDGKNQYLNVLLTGGEGPVDSITDIRINDNPVANYDGIVVDTRLGTNDQAVIPNFNDAPTDEGLAYELELDEGYSTQLSGGTGTQGLEITLECSNGLYQQKDDGSLGKATVTVQAEYRLADGEWIAWDTWVISGAETSAVRSVHRLDNLTAGQYEVRCQCTAKSGTSTRYMTRVFWTQITTIIYDDFVHPNKVLVGIKALATSQLSGNINVTWVQTRENVWAWNPGTEAYEQKPATNPAWVAYDMLHSCRKLKNITTTLDEYVVDNVPAARFAYADFVAWAARCTTLGLVFNHIFDTSSDIWESLKVPEVFGRGKVLQRGTQFGCTCDKPGVPVQMFTVGNIADDSYSKDILPITDRANCVEISFLNELKSYNKDNFSVFGEDWDEAGTVLRPTQITLKGCTDYATAYQHGMYLLRLNKLELRTITWKADIDAIACQYGDQVLIQHDVPQWGVGGRIEAATTLTLTLDRPVTMEAGKQYSVIVRLQDDSLVTRSVVTDAGEQTEITVSTAFAAAPHQYDLYSFGLVDSVAKPFIIIDVDRDNDKRATLSAIEYVAAVYEESLDAPVVNYTVPTIAELTVVVTESSRPTIGTIDLAVSFVWPRDSRAFNANIYADGILKKTVSVNTAGEYLINVPASGTYVIIVSITDGVGGLIATGTTTYEVATNIPATPSGLALSISGSTALATWSANDATNIDFYELRTNTNTGVEAGTVFAGPALLCYPVLATRAGTLYLYAHNTAGYYSAALTYGYSFAAPAAPTINVVDVFQGFVISTSAIPAGAIGINVHVDDGVSESIFFSPNNVYKYTALSAELLDISAAFVDYFGEGTESGVVSRAILPLIDSSWVHVAENTVFEDSVIVERMLAAQSITAAKIQSLLGLVIPSSDGSATKFEADGINWYSNTGIKYGSVKRAIQGSALNGKFVQFSAPWLKKPFILLSPKSVQTMVSGYTTSNLQIVCEPYSNDPANDPDMKTGFRIRLETRVLDGSGGAVIDLALAATNSEQTAPNSPAASTDLYATVEVDMGVAEHYDAYNPDHSFNSSYGGYTLRASSYNTPDPYIPIGTTWASGAKRGITHDVADMDTVHTHHYSVDYGGGSYSESFSTGILISPLSQLTENDPLNTYTMSSTTHSWTHRHRNLAAAVPATIQFQFYYKLAADATWISAGTYDFTAQQGVLSHQFTLATGLDPGVYQIKVKRVSSSGTITAAKFKSYAVNGGGVIASTGEVNFLAIESDGNGYYTIED